MFELERDTGALSFQELVQHADGCFPFDLLSLMLQVLDWVESRIYLHVGNRDQTLVLKPPNVYVDSAHPSSEELQLRKSIRVR